MRTRHQILEQGPITLVEKIAATHSKGGQPDLRAQMTLYLRGNRSWTGVPTEMSYAKEGRFVQLESAEKKKVVSINLDDIQVVEFDDLDSIHSFFERPWQQDSRFIQVSRMQLLRECETIWSFLPSQKLVVDLDSFAKTDDTPGAIWAWIEILKSEVQAILATPLGTEAINSIKQIIIVSGVEIILLEKVGQNLTFKVPLVAKSFDRAELFKLLNESL